MGFVPDAKNQGPLGFRETLQKILDYGIEVSVDKPMPVVVSTVLTSCECSGIVI